MATTTEEAAPAAPATEAVRAGEHPPGDEHATDEGRIPGLRSAVAICFPVIAAGVMVGGVFIGASPRVYACVAGVLGVALGAVLARGKSPLITNALVAVGLFAIGLVMVLPEGLDAVTNVQTLAREAAAEADVTRPPVPWNTGWQAIVGWLMGIVGFVAAWVAVKFGRTAVGLVVPLPVAAIAAISVPDAEQVVSGIVVLVLFAVGLGLVSGEQALGHDAPRPPLSYELLKAAKAIPVIALITVALVGLAQTDFLFPDPVIDPAEEPQLPRAKPLSEVVDRVLFEAEDPDGGEPVAGPWRLGVLDVYDGKDFRLPALTSSRLTEVDDPVLEPDLVARRGRKAVLTVRGLGGTVIPMLPNTVEIGFEGPPLVLDRRTSTLRFKNGQVQAGNRIQIAAARLPTLDELRAAYTRGSVPESLTEFTEVPPPPPAVQQLLAEAEQAGDTPWDQWDHTRTYVLENVVASGTGTPVSIPPERVQEILGTTLEATPFEIVAVQTLLARWIGLPARIGYGYDGGDIVNGALQVRPKHGAAFPEVWLPGLKWLPVIGTPEQARPSVGSDPGTQQQDPNVLPSNDIAVQMFLPTIDPPSSTTAENIRRGVLYALLAALVAGLAYVLWPVARKGWLRSRRRAAARAAGSRDRIALAYAEWRDVAADFGFGWSTETPLMYLDRFVDDPEHTELAWLVTRALWGDMRATVTEADATLAEELSRSLQRRLGAAQPASVRMVAAMSRTSLRDPFAPETDLTRRDAPPSDADLTGVLDAEIVPTGKEDRSHVKV